MARKKPWWDPFIETLATTGNVSASAKLIGKSRFAVYAARDSDEEFAKRWDEALEEACDTLEAEARRRALEGVDQPVYYLGEECGRIRKYSDTLLMFLLNGYRSSRFKRGEEGGSSTVTVNVKYDDESPDSDDAAATSGAVAGES